MQDQVLAAIKNTLVANGIDLAFPTQQILFHDQTEETDGDRTRQREGWPASPTFSTHLKKCRVFEVYTLGRRINTRGRVLNWL
jgi:hypothetical protein